MAHIQLTEEYNSLGGVGGTCALCNASKRTTDRPERIITTDQVTDMIDPPPGVWPEKWMEFCETCVTEMAHLLGMITELEKDGLVDTLNQKDEVIQGLLDERDSLKAALDVAVKALTLVKGVPEAPAEPVVATRGRK